MQTKSIGELRLIYRAEDAEAAGIVEDACLRSLPLIADTWGLQAPRNCRVYVMASWWEFMFHSPLWPWRLFMLITLPLWFARVTEPVALRGGLDAAIRRPHGRGGQAHAPHGGCR